MRKKQKYRKWLSSWLPKLAAEMFPFYQKDWYDEKFQLTRMSDFNKQILYLRTNNENSKYSFSNILSASDRF